MGASAVATIARIIFTAIGHEAGWRRSRMKRTTRFLKSRGDVSAWPHVTTPAASASASLFFSASCSPRAAALDEKSALRKVSTSCGRSLGCILSAQSIARRNSGLYLPLPSISAEGSGSGSSRRAGAS
jgi:hypothetical protein